MQALQITAVTEIALAFQVFGDSLKYWAHLQFGDDDTRLDIEESQKL